MIRLDLPVEPHWLDLPHGVRVLVRPLTTAIYQAANAKGLRLAAGVLREHAEIRQAGGTVEGLPDLEDDDARAGLSQMLFSQALAEAAILAWEGVLDADGGPAPVAARQVHDLMRIHSMAEAFVDAYTRVYEALVAEGNASRPAPSGTSAAGRNTAGGAATTDSPAPAAA